MSGFGGGGGGSLVGDHTPPATTATTTSATSQHDAPISSRRRRRHGPAGRGAPSGRPADPAGQAVSPVEAGVSAVEEGAEVGEGNVGEGADDGEPGGGSEGDDMGDSQRRTPRGERRGNPRRRVLDRHAASGSTPSAAAAARYGSGSGLPLVTSSPVIDAANDPAGAAAITASASRRHDMVTIAHGSPAATHSASSSRGAGAPRQLVRAPSRSHRRAGARRSRAARAGRRRGSRRITRRVEQVEPDDRVGVVAGPGAVELGDELVLARDPVGLGVDERAIHVPQDRRRFRSPPIGVAAYELSRRRRQGAAISRSGRRPPASRRGRASSCRAWPGSPARHASGSGSANSSSIPRGTTCHDNPNRSFSQPHWLSSPPSVSLSQ